MSENTSSSVYSVCVYCGSGTGTEPAYEQAASELGQALALNGLPLIFGGGAIGLMGVTARACLNEGGHVTGIVPDFLTKREIVLNEVSELIITETMHERKMEMFTRADAFVVLPGGIGTLDEVAEMLSWCQLGHHSKPIILANINAFWSPFVTLLNHMREKEFIRTGYGAPYMAVDSIAKAVDILKKAAGR